MFALLRYGKLIMAGGAALVLLLLLVRYNGYVYNKGRLAGIASMQKTVDEANAKIATIEKKAYENAENYRKRLEKVSYEYQSLKTTQQEAEKVRYVQVQKIVEKPVYRNICLDAAGVSELNHAIKGN